MFELHPRLAADTLPVTQLELSELRLMNDARFCWCILVPRRAGITGVHQLTAEDQFTLTQESSRVSRALEQLLQPDRINIGALGNLVPQLHWHVVARSSEDPCWPGPVWGCGERSEYSPLSATQRITELKQSLESLHGER